MLFALLLYVFEIFYDKESFNNLLKPFKVNDKNDRI